MQNIFFFQTQTIPDDSNLFHQFKKQNIYFSYFQVDQNYYLLFYRQTPIDLHFIYQSIDVIQELDFKQRKIRSFRGFFLYALEITQNAQDYQILQTNLQPFFWKKVKNTIRQNKQGALLQFLFPNATDNEPSSQGSSPALQELQNQVDSLAEQVERLQQKVIHLETLRKNSKYPAKARRKLRLSDSLEAPNDIKIIQKGNSTMEVKKGPYLTENQSQIRNSTSGSDALKINFEDSETTPFITLSNLSEDQKIEIIKTGFQLQAQGEISLKKYYETTQEHSLFQSKRYSIKTKQGKSIGKKINYQKNFWSNSSKTSQIGTLDPNATLPDSPSNVLGLVDNFDVPVHEKSSMEGSILKGYNETKNIIFLNNVTNV